MTRCRVSIERAYGHHTHSPGNHPRGDYLASVSGQPGFDMGNSGALHSEPCSMSN
jgi:hypothetical protein